MAQKLLTWQQKVEKGIPLNHLEQVKQAAWRSTSRRLQDEADERERQKQAETAPTLAEFNAQQAAEEVPEDSNKKKGN